MQLGFIKAIDVKIHNVILDMYAALEFTLTL